MSEQNRVEVIARMNGYHILGAPHVEHSIEGNSLVWKIGTAAAIDTHLWNQEDHGTAYLGPELDAIALWWLRKNPGLLAEVLSEEQRNELADTIEHYRVTAMVEGTKAGRNEYNAKADVLQSILSPKEG